MQSASTLNDQGPYLPFVRTYRQNRPVCIEMKRHRLVLLNWEQSALKGDLSSPSQFWQMVSESCKFSGVMISSFILFCFVCLFVFHSFSVNVQDFETNELLDWLKVEQNNAKLHLFPMFSWLNVSLSNTNLPCVLEQAIFCLSLPTFQVMRLEKLTCWSYFCNKVIFFH